MSLVVRYLQGCDSFRLAQQSLSSPPPCSLPIVTPAPHTQLAPHEFKFSIWWDKADAAFRIKLAESHTLVEGAVINGN